jgi:hypothetical protein
VSLGALALRPTEGRRRNGSPKQVSLKLRWGKRRRRSTDEHPARMGALVKSSSSTESGPDEARQIALANCSTAIDLRPGIVIGGAA